MINFSDIFQGNYQYYLKSINYNAITIGQVKEKLEPCFTDELSFEVIENRELRLEIKRTIKFIPNILYELSVSYGATLRIRDGAENVREIDWQQEFRENPVCVKLLYGLLSRISLQVAQITSSYGRTPVITSPTLSPPAC